MPIRMEEDDPRQERNDNNPQPGGGGFNTKWLLFLIPLLLKRPKLLIPILIIGALFYFFSGGDFLNQFLPTDNAGGLEESGYSLGFDANQEEYDKRLVFASLADGKNGLPSRVSLLQYAPPRLNQGRQGSCVGWASAYAARSILHAQQTGQNPRNSSFSPSYVYNQIAFEGCQGTYLHYAMETMLNNGALPFSEFEYNEGSCRLQPSQQEVRQAQQFKIRGYERLSVGANNYKVDINGIRQNLAAGAPVVIGMMVGQSFTQSMRNRQVWQPTRTDLNGVGLGGHAMCVIGYDDTALNGEGAFHIMNSWGADWGDDGNAWVGYDDFEYFVKEAYGLYPMGNAKQQQADKNKLAVKFGLVDNSTQNNIQLRKVANNVFQTSNPIRVGDKFKVEVTNSQECYTYIFGRETDGSSYVLFPYTPKHSAYCGIMGTRIFPRDYSMVADDVGSTDWISIVVSKEQLDFQALNNLINRQNSDSYPGKVTAALQSELFNSVNFSNGGNTIDFEATLQNGKNAVAMFIAIDKQ